MKKTLENKIFPKYHDHCSHTKYFTTSKFYDNLVYPILPVQSRKLTPDRRTASDKFPGGPVVFVNSPNRLSGKLFCQPMSAVQRQSVIHTENSRFASPTLGQHISTFRGYRILFSIRNPYINHFTNHFCSALTGVYDWQYKYLFVCLYANHLP
jgi:hypothetical protein